jgi:hypothetical protein
MQRREAELGSFAVNARPETARIREFGRHVFEIAALSRASLKRYNLRVWTVGSTGIEPVTPEPIIESVSDTQVRNKIFMQRRAGETALSSR